MPDFSRNGASAVAEPVGVLLLEEQTLWREFLAEFVNKLPGYRVMASTASRAEALDGCEALRPRLVVVGQVFSEVAPRSAVSALKLRHPDSNLLVVSSSLQPEWVQEAVSAGVSGFIDTSIDLAMLRQAVETVAHGGEYFSPRVSSILTELLRRRTQPQPVGGALLTFRECQVLREIARGRISKEMAGELGLSVFTIENVRRRIMQKTGLHSVAALTLHAMKLGLIPPEMRAQPAPVPELAPAADCL